MKLVDGWGWWCIFAKIFLQWDRGRGRLVQAGESIWLQWVVGGGGLGVGHYPAVAGCWVGPDPIYQVDYIAGLNNSYSTNQPGTTWFKYILVQYR